DHFLNHRAHRHDVLVQRFQVAGQVDGHTRAYPTERPLSNDLTWINRTRNTAVDRVRNQLLFLFDDAFEAGLLLHHFTLQEHSFVSRRAFTFGTGFTLAAMAFQRT